MMSSSKKKQQNRPSGGSRYVTYVLVALMAVLVGYYIVLPAFTPKSTVTTTTNANGAKITFNTSTDISGAYVVATGSNLPHSQNVSATFGSNILSLANSTSGAKYCRTSDTGTLTDCTFWVPSLPSGTYRVNMTAGTQTIGLHFKIPEYNPPVSTVIVTVTSVSLGLITQLVTRRVVDLNAERRMRAEVNAFNKEKREATLAKDKDKMEKLKKREVAVQQEQLRVQRSRLKVTAITFVPLLAVYYLMASFLGGYGVIVAYTPIPLFVGFIAGATQAGSYFQLSLFWWYFLSSFTFSTMLSRLLHTTT
jgi:uncharacterized membrane protein (DUF106 family)